MTDIREDKNKPENEELSQKNVQEKSTDDFHSPKQIDKLSDTSNEELPSSLEIWEGSSAYVEQGTHWSSALIWICTTLLGGSLLWAFTARLDQTVSARGRLEPAGSVRKVESPSTGVVSKVYVEDGQMVKIGDPLFDVEAKGLVSKRQALITSLRLLDLQARGLKTIIQSEGNPDLFAKLPEIPQVKDEVLMSQLNTATQQTLQLRSQLAQINSRLSSRRETLRLRQLIAEDLEPLYREGAMSRNQYLSQLNQVQESRADVAGLKEELVRVIGLAAGQLNTINRQIINLKADLESTKESLAYRTIKAPIEGKVFDSQLLPYAVISTDQTVLKLVPANRLQASIVISDSDIGFVKVGMPATVAVDSFPSGEFGYINGKLTSIGSDALPPDGSFATYRFPATITLQEQTVESGKNELNLQSGMGVTANIRLRSRPVISLISDLFTKQLDGVKRFR